MAISKWLCTKTTNNMFVKIVHPGGHRELHDKPVLASDIMRENPKCIVAYPHIFKNPWAIVQPDTILTPGQKFYVVPMSTVRKLQGHQLKSRSPVPDGNSSEADNKEKKTCGISPNKNTKDIRRGSCLSDDKCTICMFNVFRKKSMNGDAPLSNSSFWSCSYGIWKRKKDLPTGSPNRPFMPYDHWQPALESIREE